MRLSAMPLCRLLAALVMAHLSTASSFGRAENEQAGHHRLLDSRPCKDSVFRMQTNFWVNLHLFLRAESRRRRMHASPEMPISSLSPADQSSWIASLNVYDGIAQLNLQFDKRLIDLVNRLAQVSQTGTLQTGTLPADQAEPAIVDALNAVAPIYRAHVWPAHRKQDHDWIAANCSDVQHYDRAAKEAIATAFRVDAPSKPILVDLARETGRTLAYTTTDGPPGTAGHTILAPQKNMQRVEALNTILHEISHTMVDNTIIEALNKEAARQHVTIPDDLWHALTLYSTTEITGRLIRHQYADETVLDTERASMFQKNGWNQMLQVLSADWQPYLDNKTDFNAALAKLVHDAGK
jgi:hypothetical protein